MEILEKITKKCFSEFISCFYLSKYKDENFEICFFGDGNNLILSFYDLRISQNNFIKTYSFDNNNFKIGFNPEIDEPICIGYNECVYNFENKPVFLSIPFVFYKEVIPRKFFASSFEYSRGHKFATEFTESKEKVSKKIDTDILKRDFEKNVPLFILGIKKRIYINTLFIENTKRKHE